MGDQEAGGVGSAGAAGGPIDTVDVDFDEYMLGIGGVHRRHGRHRAIVPRIRHASINQEPGNMSAQGESQEGEYHVSCMQEPPTREQLRTAVPGVRST